MSQLPCGHIEAIIQKITMDLQGIDDQLHAFEVEGMNLVHPWAYVVLQRQVDRLARKKRSLQDAWDRSDIASLRSIPHEVQHAESLDLLQALNAGVPVFI